MVITIPPKLFQSIDAGFGLPASGEFLNQKSEV
jgi:hypothetical protein